MKITYEEMQERRERIIQCAYRLFCERGIENVTLLEIAKVAKVGESTIYRYFENKTNLVHEIFSGMWDIIISREVPKVENREDYQALNGYMQIERWLDFSREFYTGNFELILFFYEVRLYLLRHKTEFDWCQQETLTELIRKPCLNALDKGKTDGSVCEFKDREELFYAIWSALWGCVALYGRDEIFEKRFQVMKAGILHSLSSGCGQADPAVQDSQSVSGNA